MGPSERAGGRGPRCHLWLGHWSDTTPLEDEPVKISARNQLPATVKSVTEGEVMAEVTLVTDAGQELVAAITANSAERLGLQPGAKAVALIKATEVLVAVED